MSITTSACLRETDSSFMGQPLTAFRSDRLLDLAPIPTKRMLIPWEEHIYLCTMVPDLPVELWLHILSMLPRGQRRKLVGINRVLFTLVMNDIYQEVRLTDDDKEIRKTFHQLKYPSIASRVQHVYIRPGFFSAIVEPMQTTFLRRMRTKVLHLGRKKARFPTHLREDFLLVAQHALANCSATEEFTIVLHNFLPPASFELFIKALWASLGPNLRQLTIDATLAKFPLILEPGISQSLPKLADLNLNLATSIFSSADERDVLVMRIIQSFMKTVSETLQSLTISSAELTDVTPLFSGPYFPQLQKLCIHIAVNRLTFVVPYSLTKFLTRHKTTLQHFSLGLPDGAALRNEPDFAYETWVMREFYKLDLPMLQSLHVWMFGGYGLGDVVAPPLSSARLPQLVSLTLSDAYMSHDDIEATFSDLFDGNRLESLRLRVQELSPKILDTLAAKLPHLVSLDLTFKHRSIQNLPVRESEDLYDFDFEQQMKVCKYPNWMLRDLKLSRIHWNSCAKPHYQLRTMEIVARCLPLAVTLGIVNDCACDTN